MLRTKLEDQLMEALSDILREANMCNDKEESRAEIGWACVKRGNIVLKKALKH